MSNGPTERNWAPVRFERVESLVFVAYYDGDTQLIAD